MSEKGAQAVPQEAAAPPSGPEREPVAPVRLPVRLRRPPALTAFQPDALEIEEQTPPGPTRLILYTVAAFLLLAVAWAALSKVDEVVRASGRLITKAPNLVVQPLETAVIRSIDVAVGDVVPAGARLATLDPTVQAADVGQLDTRRVDLAAQIARLGAEIDGGEYRPSAEAGAAGRLQRDLYRQRRAHYLAQLRKFDEDISRIEASIATNRSDQAATGNRLTVLRQIEEMRAELFARQTGSKLNLLEARQMRLDLEGTLAHLRRQETELGHQSEALRAERAAFVEDFRRTALEQLVELRAEHDRIVEELAKARFRQGMVVLKAPSEAVVLEVAQRSIGSVVREAEPLFTLVPLDQPLEAEVAIDAADIGHIATGQTARVKFDAFPFQKYGTGSGVVRVVSGDAFAAEENTGRPPFYRARLDLLDTKLRNVPATFRMLPGMTVSAEIQTGQRSVLSYFLYPLLRGIDESLREP